MNKLSLKANVWIANLIMCVGGVITLIDMFNHGGKARIWVVGIGMLFIFAGLGYRMVTVKCPYCGDPLTGKYTLPKDCPHCGHSLNERQE